jgi:hypothetical protein
MRHECSCGHRLPNPTDLVRYPKITHCNNRVRNTSGGEVQSFPLLCGHDAVLPDVTQDEIANQEVMLEGEQDLERIKRQTAGPVLAKPLGVQAGKSNHDCFKNGAGVASSEALQQYDATVSLPNGEARASILVRGAPSDPLTGTRRSDACEAC